MRFLRLLHELSVLLNYAVLGNPSYRLRLCLNCGDTQLSYTHLKKFPPSSNTSASVMAEGLFQLQNAMGKVMFRTKQVLFQENTVCQRIFLSEVFSNTETCLGMR